MSSNAAAVKAATRNGFAKTLVNFGWHLSDKFIEDSSELNANDLVTKALNHDLQHIGAKCLPNEVLSGQSLTFQANYVLQLNEVRNIAAPLANQNLRTARPMYRISLTDGHSTCSAVVVDHTNKLKLDIAPGTKIHLFGPIRAKSKVLFLSDNNFRILGGLVPFLLNQWQISKHFVHSVGEINMTEEAPPKWVAFGTTLSTQVDTSQRTLTNKRKREDTTSEFGQARQMAISDAIKLKFERSRTGRKPSMSRSSTFQSYFSISSQQQAPVTAKPDHERNEHLPQLNSPAPSRVNPMVNLATSFTINEPIQSKSSPIVSQQNKAITATPQLNEYGIDLSDLEESSSNNVPVFIEHVPAQQSSFAQKSSPFTQKLGHFNKAQSFSSLPAHRHKPYTTSRSTYSNHPGVKRQRK